jgi:hypothetical protein
MIATAIRRLWDENSKGYRDVKFELVIDEGGVIDMLALRAYQTKSGRATVLGKSIIVRVVD